MIVNKEVAGDVLILTAAGNLVASEIDSFYQQMATLTDDYRHHLVMDMSGINFIDSSGLDAVMTISRQAAGSGGNLVWAAPLDNVMKVFRITRADQKIILAATRTEALQLVRTGK